MASPDPLAPLKQLKETARKARMPHERNAFLNLAFYLNEQYTYWDEDAGTIKRIAKPKASTARPVVNKIMHYVRTAHAAALQDKPQGDVLPPTDDYGDISDAFVAKAYIDYVSGHDMADYDRQLARATLWALLAGNGYLKWCWNPTTEAIEILPVSFFELYIDPYARSWSKVRYAIHSQFMDLEQVYDAFGVEIPQKEAESVDMAKAALLRGMGSAPAVNGVEVNELWEKPSRRHPKGRYAVWTSAKMIVAPTDLPYKHLVEDRMLPFTQLGAIERPDSVYFVSPVTYLRPAQMELNLYHAQRLEIRKKFSNPKWGIPAELEMEAMPDDSPDQILRWSGPMGLEPKLIQPTTYPPSDDGDMLEQQMMHIVGQHEVSQAQVPGRVESAKAIEMLKESDAGAYATLRETISSSNTQGWYQVLELARAYESEEKIVQAYSLEGVPEVKHFRAGDMSPGFRIRTTMTTGLARSRTARNEETMRMVELGVLTDPETIASLLDVPLGRISSEYRALDVKQARNENMTLRKGEAIEPNSWDNHTLHLREHNQFRKTHEYLMLDDETKQKLEHHCSRHEELLDAAMAKQAQMMQSAQQMAGGADQGKPAAPPQGQPATDG